MGRPAAPLRAGRAERAGGDGALGALGRQQAALANHPKDGVFHFYEKKDKGYVSDKTGDLQRVDLGIALCHFMSGMESLGKTPVFTVSDPGVAVPDGVFYIASVREGASA